MTLIYCHKLCRKRMSEMKVSFYTFSSISIFWQFVYMHVYKMIFFFITGKSRIFWFLSKIFPWYIFVNTLDFIVELYYCNTVELYSFWYLRLNMVHRGYRVPFHCWGRSEDIGRAYVISYDDDMQNIIQLDSMKDTGMSCILDACA